MNDQANLQAAQTALHNPSLSPAELAAIAGQHPFLWEQVAAHPAAYPELLTWLEQMGVTIPSPPPPVVAAPLTPAAPTPTQAPRESSGVGQPWQQTPQAGNLPYATQPTTPYANQTSNPQPLAAPGQYQLPQMPQAPKSPKKRLPLVITGAVVVAGVVAGFFVWNALPKDDISASSRSPLPSATPRATTPASSPSATPSKSPSASAKPTTSNPGQVSVVPSATPVPIKPGEVHYIGSAKMVGAKQVDVGFIMNADKTAVHDLMVALSGIALLDKSGVSRVSHSTTKEFKIVNGTLEASITTGVDLVIRFDGDQASGTLHYNSEFGGFGSIPKSMLDLGTGSVTLSAR